MAIIDIKNLSFTYSGQTQKALDNINLSIEEGEFLLICGESGCGKSTLLQLLKRQISPKGKREGDILYNGIDILNVPEIQTVCDIGYVMQSPDKQIVTDKVWHELAFALESVGEKSHIIRRKVAEICGFFGISEWYNKKTCELSGGQKQLLNLASVMVTNPKVLIFDEPTSQLDPIAASEFIATLQKINSDLGLTIIIVEHRLEEIFKIANKVAVMGKATIAVCDTPSIVCSRLNDDSIFHNMQLALPVAARIFNLLADSGKCPISVKDGKTFLSSNYKNTISSFNRDKTQKKDNIAIDIKDGYFRYIKAGNDILKGINLSVYQNEFLCILGANGVGKTTLLNVMSGASRLYRGKYRLWNKKISEYFGGALYRENISYLPQNPQLLFSSSTVYGDLIDACKIMGYDKTKSEGIISDICQKLQISSILKSHPYDISGGEQQKAALGKILIMNPKMILLDEPTKGLDAYSKKLFAEIIKTLKNEGKTIVMVTHDVEFSAEYADRCAMFFDGEIVSHDIPSEFFSENNFYTTAASKISRHMYQKCITADDVVKIINANKLSS